MPGSTATESAALSASGTEVNGLISVPGLAAFCTTAEKNWRCRWVRSKSGMAPVARVRT
ncbi:hypothetical protein GCM10027612_09670 [Microbispora bryophytorum subsp. camponoti]